MEKHVTQLTRFFCVMFTNFLAMYYLSYVFTDISVTFSKTTSSEMKKISTHKEKKKKKGERVEVLSSHCRYETTPLTNLAVSVLTVLVPQCLKQLSLGGLSCSRAQAATLRDNTVDTHLIVCGTCDDPELNGHVC